jgi:hypothetical protein
MKSGHWRNIGRTDHGKDPDRRRTPAPFRCRMADDIGVRVSIVMSI